MKGGLILNRILIPLYGILLWSLLYITPSYAQETLSQEEIYEQRMTYYYQFENVIVPWYFLAAIDQYERNIQAVRKDIPKRDSVVAIQFSDEFWSGPFNPTGQDTSPSTISYFGGFGLDGNNDGIANPQDDADILFSMASYLSKFGTSIDEFKIALWQYYYDEKTVNQILTIAQIYEKYNTIALNKRAFPVPISSTYSYKSTWGANRGWGGRRSHQGTDLFANYGTPIHSTSYGVVEVKGWNEFGGWRIGIRDIYNTYHYYAHLGSYNNDLAVGDIVEPGTIVGYVGSSGYGKEGTSGKFPPHLHYGMYKFDGRNEWAFDPYPSLLIWERKTKSSK